MAEVKVTKKAAVPSKGGKVSHIHIERMANGYKVHHHRDAETKRVPGGGSMSVMSSPHDPMVFSGAKAKKMMLAHVNDLSDQMGEGLGTGMGDGGGQGGDPAGVERPAAVTG